MRDGYCVRGISSRRRQSRDHIGFANYITRFKTLRHCTVPLLQPFDSRHLVLEYMPGGDFLMLLLQKAPLREEETCFYISEMINGIDACHKLGFMHRDVKV